MWPAFWMLGANFDSAGWPNCGKIDVMEDIGARLPVLHGTIHRLGDSGGGIAGIHTLLGRAAFADGGNWSGTADASPPFPKRLHRHRK
jgi:hypothetical protein